MRWLGGTNCRALERSPVLPADHLQCSRSGTARPDRRPNHSQRARSGTARLDRRPNHSRCALANHRHLGRHCPDCRRCGVKCRFRRTSKREPRYGDALHLLSGSVKQARQRDLGRPVICIEVEQKSLRHGGNDKSANPVPGRVLSALHKVVDRIGGSGLTECGDRKDCARSCQTLECRHREANRFPPLYRRSPAIYKSNDPDEQ